MGLGRYGPAVSGAILSGSAAPGSASGDLKTAAAAEKTAFDIKLEKFDAAAKIKVIKEVRTFTDLGLKEAKDLVEKVPVVLKKGLTKEEAGPIIEKLQALGATIGDRRAEPRTKIVPLIYSLSRHRTHGIKFAGWHSDEFFFLQHRNSCDESNSSDRAS
uniref:Large ribosomal subunit protein bL12 C-terminal domain-containing protein n=1 Tax=Salix viminalis TaxID=40686 RepID=A0A6N2MCH9_SALVM